MLTDPLLGCIDVSKISYCHKKNYDKELIFYETEKQRDEAYERLKGYMKDYKEGGKMKSLRDWFDKHSDAIITIAVIVIVDHFLFSGSLRERLKGMMTGLLSKCEKQLENK